MAVFCETDTVPLTYRAVSAVSSRRGGPVAAAALMLIALHHELPNATVRHRGRMWMHCHPMILETQIPLGDDQLWAALKRLKDRGLITVREFPHPDREQGVLDGYLMCALTVKATRALAPRKWADLYGWTKKESTDA